jgi:hypothetical protein
VDLCSGRSGCRRGGTPLDDDVAVRVGEEHGQDHLLGPCPSSTFLSVCVGGARGGRSKEMTYILWHQYARKILISPEKMTIFSC